MKKLKRRQFFKSAALSAGVATVLRQGGSLNAAQRPRVFKISKNSGVAIHIGPGVTEVTRFAAEEIQKYLKKISSIELQITTSAELRDDPVLILASSNTEMGSSSQLIKAAGLLPEDSYKIRTAKDHLIIAGQNPRGSLYGVYALLESLGCRFYGLGEGGEIIPRMNPVAVPALDVERKPSFRWRDWSEDSRYAHRNQNPDHEGRHEKFWLDLIDWFGKNQINMTGNDDYPAMVAEFKKRGIVQWTGGHLIPSLLPRQLFEGNPDYFRMDPTGKRVSSGNFCPSNSAALKIVADNAVKYLEERPATYNLQVWGEDVWDGSWCYCPNCSKMTVQDQYLTACNAIAKAVKEAGYDIDVDAIAYHDSIEPDITIKPEPNLRMMWAPRERSYGHALNDMRSERNQWYVECFEEWTSIFGPKNMNLFEYYTDNILFRTFPISCPHLIARDVQYYTDIGLNNHFLVCHLGDYAFQSEPLGCLAYARMIFDRSQDIDEVIADYCKVMYGPAASLMHKWHDDFEHAMHYCATFGDIQRVPTDCGPRNEKLMSELKQSLKLLKTANFLVKRARSSTSDPLQRARIETQSWVNEFALLMVNGLLHQVTAEYYFARINLIFWARKGADREPNLGLEGRYMQARDSFTEAVKYYEDASAFTQALPAKERSVWCDSDLLRHNENLCGELRAKIAECEQHV